jgi:hypothetical protein
MFGRMKDAMADAAETLRRAFAGLGVTAVAPEPFVPVSQGMGLPQAEPCVGLEPPVAHSRGMALLRDGVAGREMPSFRAAVQGEAGWAQWGASAEVIRMTPLELGLAARIAVPPLPRKAKAMGRVEPPDRPGVRRGAEPLSPPGTRRLDPSLEGGEVMAGLEAMLALPVPIQKEDLQRLPKGLWMRYSLQLVRATGENVRNLEVLGLFQIPRKGVTDLRHDAKRGRVVLRLDASALKAPRAPFMLARRKDDSTLVSCFVEDP